MKDTLIDALKASGKVLLEFFDSQIDTVQKESQSSIVTIADYKSDSAISGIIRGKFPAHNILTEESGFINNHSEYTWIIDPLDGTSNFAAGIPWFGVLITLFKRNIPVMGGAFLPVEEKLYFAEKGKGVLKNNIPLPPIQEKELRDSLIAFCVDYTENTALLNKETGMYSRIVQHSRNIRSTNSLIDFIYVAEGRFGAVVNLNTKVWDISGLGLIISEAGGAMRKTDDSEIRFTVSRNLMEENFPVMAGSRKILDSLIEILK